MYLTIFTLLLVMELVFFKFADKFNIIDKPNHRSVHTEITFRGHNVKLKAFSTQVFLIAIEPSY